jgi:esterase/lipase superfamily enzyme
LLDLVERSGAETINLVAHSMGNVGLTEALKEIQAMDEKPLFNQVVLAAPDIDANIFKSRIAPHIVGKAKNLTLYTSQSDLALIASRFFNHGQRIGDSGPEALNFPGIDTIDATAVDSSLLGHTYYGDNVSVLTDLGQLLRNQPITNRHYLKQVNHGMTFYWAFDPLRISKTFDASVR